jgi:GT2 family glycosyltransferase
MRATFLSKIGLFATQYFNLFEDIDWSMRAIRMGYNLLVNPKASILHKSAATFGGTKSPFYAYYYKRNHLLWIRRNKNRKSRCKFILLLLRKEFPTFRSFIKIILDKNAYEKSIRQAWFDYFFNRFHKRDYPWLISNGKNE